ncbi:MAG: CAP domain-containing protein, partial [Myxococcaceae bacterium]|nr:CAP domain-containing protein [Myxococcaceae bacterium]
MSTLALLGLTLVAALGPADLERDSERAVRRAFEHAGRRVPATDPALTQAARKLAQEALSDGSRNAADPRNVTELISLAQGADPHPRTLVVASSLREAALEAFRTHPELSTEPATHLGVGSAVRGDRAAVVALFVERLAELEPFPRQLPAPGLSRRLCGRLESGLKMAEVFVTRPAGDVARAATHLEGTRFCAPLDFTSNGLHEVEVVARGPNGPEVVALFHVEVGARRGRAKREHLEEPRTDEAARAQMVERVNALRRAHGASPLVADPALDAVAQAYSDRMAREGFFAHVAPDGSDLRKRLTQAGYAYRAAGENLGFAPGP